jgi:hypothetical protein
MKEKVEIQNIKGSLKVSIKRRLKIFLILNISIYIQERKKTLLSMGTTSSEN